MTYDPLIDLINAAEEACETYKEGTLDSDIKKNPRKYDLEDLEKAAHEFVIKRVNEGTPFPAIAEAVLEAIPGFAFSVPNVVTRTRSGRQTGQNQQLAANSGPQNGGCHGDGPETGLGSPLEGDQAGDNG